MQNIADSKIEAIKTVRQLMKDTFGVTPGLRETKDFVESMGRIQLKDNLGKAVIQLRNAGVDPQTIRNELEIALHVMVGQ